MTAKNMYNRHKSVFSLLIAIAMIFSMLPVSAFASDDVQDDIIIIDDLEAATPATTGGEETGEIAAAAPASAPLGIAPAAGQRITKLDFLYGITSDTDKLTDEGWKWEDTAKILTLNGLDLLVSSGVAINLPGGSTIVLSGTNTVVQTGTNIGIYSDGSLKIEGTGTLSVTAAGSSAIFSYSSFTMKNGTVTATSNGASSCGLYSTSNFTMEGGTLTAIGNSYYGIEVNSGNFTMTGGTIIAKGASNAVKVNGTVPQNITIKQGSAYVTNVVFDGSPKTIKTAVGGTAVTDAKITAGINYTLFLHTDGQLYENSAGGTDVTNDFNSYGAGTVSIMGAGSTWTLILKEGFDFETSAATALSVPAGTTIQVDGNATVASTKSDNSADAVGIKATGALTVNVAAGKTLTVSMSNGCETSYGIVVNNGSFTKLGDGTLSATAGTATNQSYGIGIVPGDFTMTAGTIIAITNGGALYDSNAMVVTGTVSIGDIPVKGWGGSAYTIDASFQDFSAPTRSVPTIKIIQDSRGSAVYNAKLGKDAPVSEPPATTPSSGGSSSSKEEKPAPPAPVIAPMDDKASGVLSTAINNAANTASSSGKSLDVKLKNVSNFTKANAAAIIAKAKALGKPATVSSDVISEDGKYVEVRVTVDPTLIKQNVRLDGYTRASQTFITQTKFTKHFENKTAIISLGQDGKFGQTAKISARLDFKGFDQSNLYLYSYDKKANKYTLITSKDYKIDKKGYLVFNTDFGGDIIVSNGKLMRK